MPLHLHSALAKVVVAIGKCAVKNWYPHAREVPLRSEIAPETKIQLGHQLAMNSRSATFVRGPFDGPGDVCPAERIKRGDIRLGRSRAGGPCNELVVQGVADDDFDHASGLQYRSGSIQIPLVQFQCPTEVVVAPGKVRTQAVRRQQVTHDFRAP